MLTTVAREKGRGAQAPPTHHWQSVPADAPACSSAPPPDDGAALDASPPCLLSAGGRDEPSKQAVGTAHQHGMAVPCESSVSPPLG